MLHHAVIHQFYESTHLLFTKQSYFNSAVLHKLLGLSVMRSERQSYPSVTCSLGRKTNKQQSIGNKSIPFESFTLNDSLSHNIHSSFSTESLDSLPLEKDLTSHVFGLVLDEEPFWLLTLGVGLS